MHFYTAYYLISCGIGAGDKKSLFERRSITESAISLKGDVGSKTFYTKAALI